MINSEPHPLDDEPTSTYRLGQQSVADKYQRLATLARSLSLEVNTAMPDIKKSGELGIAILKELGEVPCPPHTGGTDNG